MKLFEALDALNEKYYDTKYNEIPVEKIKPVRDKIKDMKEYKKNYYKDNIDIYKERNAEYRKKLKENKKIKSIDII